MNPYPFTEIIMVVYNQLKYTEACLNSLYRNTNPESFRLLLIDSGSDKETKDFLKNYKKKAPNMELIISDENIGWCKGLNEGFKYLKPDSDYVVWCNNDVLFEDNWLPKMIKHFKGGVGAVGPTSNYVCGRQWVGYNCGQYEEVAPVLIGFCLMFRREIINIVGDIDERFGLGGSEEYDYLIRVGINTSLGCIIARDVYVHHFGSKTLWNMVGGTPQDYNSYHEGKDKILREKWGDQTVDQFLAYPEKNVLIAVPHPGFIDHRFWRDQLFLKKPPNSEIIEVVRTSAIQDARNVIAKFALENNFKYLMFMDSDMRVPPNTIFKLMDYKVPIVGGYFVSRSEPHFPCFFEYDEKQDGCRSIYKPNSGLVRGDAIGMACTLIDMKVVKALKEDKEKRGVNPLEFFYWSKFGEDMTFCLDARKWGFKTYCDTDLEILHIGEEKREYGLKDYVPPKEEGVLPS